MGIIQTIATRVRSAGQILLRAGIPLSAVTPRFMGIQPSDAGVSVTPETAMSASAVYACVNVISSAIMAMPVHVKRLRDSAIRDEHPVHVLLTTSPNEYQTPAMFWETLTVQLLLWGNCYAFIDKDAMGVPIGIYPLRSDMTRPLRLGAGPLVYNTSINGQFFTFRPDQIFHVANMSIDGVMGLSPIYQARNAIGLSLAMEKFAAKFFANGCNLGGILELPAGMKEEAVKQFVASWKRQYAGADNALRTAMLTDGMKYTPLGTNPEKSQMTEGRVHQIREAARIYRVPLHKIADLEHATFSNIEHQAIEFRQDTIQPWTVKLVQEANRKLFAQREQGKLTLVFDLDSLLLADTTARYEAYNVALNGGWMCVNEVRAKEGLPPVAGGEQYLRPLNMTPLKGADPVKDPPPAPALPNPDPNDPARAAA